MKFKNSTVVFKGGFGFISCVYCRDLEIEHKPYAQFSKATWIRFKRPGQRKWRGTVLTCDQQMAVMTGEVAYDIYTEEKETTSGIKTKESKYSSFSKEWIAELEDLAGRNKTIYYQDCKGEAQNPSYLKAPRWGSPEGSIEKHQGNFDSNNAKIGKPE